MSSPNSLSSLLPRRHSSGSLDMHPYFGKVDPAIAHWLITSYSTIEQTVLDPFCGSGTVLHEAMVHGRNAVGWDSSPLAIMIAAAKLCGIEPDEKGELLELSEGIARVVGNPSLLNSDVCIPEMPRVKSVDFWFTSVAIVELSHIKQTIHAATLSPAARLLALVAFSRIITKASNQQSESTYRRVVKNQSPGDVLCSFIAALSNVVKSAERFRSLMGGQRRELSECHDGWLIRHGSREVRLVKRDSRGNHPPSPAHLVVTSPPYLMSWDYGLYHKFRFYWLDMDLDSYEDSEIGRHLRRKRDDVERYAQDMRDTWLQLSESVYHDGTIAMVNAPSVVGGEAVDTNLLIAEAAASADWRLVASQSSLPIPGPHHGMYASLGARGTSTSGQSGKKEHVLVFSRD